NRAIIVTRKQAIEIAAIDGRRTRARHCRWEICGRQDHKAALDVLRLDRAHEVAERYLALPLVAVVATDQQDVRAIAVADSRNGNRNESVSRAVHGMRDTDEARGLTFGVEIDVGREPAHGGKLDGLRCWQNGAHVDLPRIRWARSTYAR